jgi:choline dehydrogenase-like flavoprotein
MSAGQEIHVVGSGASAVHFAQSALERGMRVTMLDVGRRKPQALRPEDSLGALKENLDDPVAYFLGEDFSSTVLPDFGAEYYGFPPSKQYVFAGIDGQGVRAQGFDPLFSYARGGLAEAWTGGVYPFDEDELAAYPFSYAEIAPHYDRVAERIGICGAQDDLARFLPVHRHLLPPLELDEHSRRLLDAYQRRKSTLNAELGVWVGRSRLATLSREHQGRAACDSTGRCLWGCPSDSLYTPSIGLRQLEESQDFRYLDGLCVTHFEIEEAGRVGAVHARRVDGGASERIPVRTLVLGAGTLSTARIYLESLRRAGEQAPRLTGLMDNRQVMMPFVNLSMIGRPFEEQSYQYHQLNMGIAGEVPGEYVHGQITTLKTALIHPIVQSVPLDLRSALFLFRHVHAALGLLNANFHDRPRPECYVELDEADGTLVVHYEPPADEDPRLRAALGTYRRALRKLGCVVPPGMTHVRPMGASVHYAGTLPMTSEARAHALTPEGRSREFENLLVVDGSGLPFLPAKNLTFTLMANASRIAYEAL